jgi:hypothetical protein
MGRAENANITGLSYDYIVQQLNDFKNSARKTSDPRKANTGLMAGFAKNMTDEEIKAAARYFSSIPYKPWIKVVESETAPKVRSQGGCSSRSPALTPALSRSAIASSKLLSTPTILNFCVTRAPASSPTCRRVASRRASPW